MDPFIDPFFDLWAFFPLHMYIRKHKYGQIYPPPLGLINECNELLTMVYIQIITYS